MQDEYILKLSCPDRLGIVAAVSSLLADNKCNIQSSAHYGDPETLAFFMRTRFKAGPDSPDEMRLLQRFGQLAALFDMKWGLHRASTRARALILVSKQGHCLNDLLYRAYTGALPLNIVGIASNHDDFSNLANWHDIPFHYLPITEQNQAEQEQALHNIIQRERVDLVILARYMQVLSPRLCRELLERCINIHHSFLPSFKGARPYQQAYDKGVKLIGATAHYVTETLDEGPIIEQDVVRVDHAHSPDDLTAMGRDIESMVLARAVKWHIEHRVLLNGNKTVVLR